MKLLSFLEMLGFIMTRRFFYILNLQIKPKTINLRFDLPRFLNEYPYQTYLFFRTKSE